MTSQTAEDVPSRKRLGLHIERIWITTDQSGHHHTSLSRPADRSAIEYMRVMTRQEVEKAAGDGVDVQQYMNSLIRTIEGQRIEINRLNEKCAALAFLQYGSPADVSENLSTTGDDNG